MILIYIVAFIAIATIISVLVWFAMQDRELNCTNNGCTGDCNQGRDCSCVGDTPDTNSNWPFPRNRP
jgi:hypothetical protein